MNTLCTITIAQVYQARQYQFLRMKKPRWVMFFQTSEVSSPHSPQLIIPLTCIYHHHHNLHIWRTCALLQILESRMATQDRIGQEFRHRINKFNSYTVCKATPEWIRLMIATQTKSSPRISDLWIIISLLMFSTQITHLVAVRALPTTINL